MTSVHFVKSQNITLQYRISKAEFYFRNLWYSGKLQIVQFVADK